MSLSHLLQFRYERPCSDSGHTPSGNYGPRRKSQLRARPKESFLQTNFKFVLSPTAPPAHPAIYDADCIIDWDYVDQVLVPSRDGALDDCAICLDAPTAPRITKCGHHFCAACVLRHLDGHRCRRCPLCFETVARGDLRPVEPTPALALDDADARLEFRLLARVKGTLTPAVVAGAADGEDEEQPPPSPPQQPEAPAEEGKAPTPTPAAATAAAPKPQLQPRKPFPGAASEGIRAVLPCVGTPAAAYSRLLAGTETQEEASLAREDGELRRARAEAAGVGEPGWLPFIDEALAEVAARRQRYAARRGAPPEADASGRPLIPGAMPAGAVASAASGAMGSTPKKGRSASPPGGRGGQRPRGYSGGENLLPPTNTLDDSGASSSASVASGDGGREGKAHPSASPDPVSHFYQLRDGSYAFLHPLNMRCLMADAGGDSRRLPPRVEGRVLEVEGMTLTPELRGRYGFLKHLPLYSQVHLVELELRPPALSEATYAQFKPEIKKRQQRRKQRERAEARERKLAAMQAASEAQGSVDWASLRGAGLTEEEIRAIQARREEGVDLNGPLPWQAMLVADEPDPEKRRERLEALMTTVEFGGGSEGGAGAGVEEGGAAASASVTDGAPEEGVGTGTSPPLVNSFAEITRRNGHFPALGEEMFPALGSSPSSGGGALGVSPPPTTAGGGGGVWGGRAGGSTTSSSGSGSGGSNPAPALASSPPAATPAGAWGRPAPPSGGGLSSTPPSSSAAAPWASAAAVAASMRTGAGGSAAVAAAAAAGKKKGKGKGVPLFSTGGQRSYA